MIPVTITLVFILGALFSSSSLADSLSLTRAELVYSYLKLDSIETKLQRTDSKLDPEKAATLFREKAIAILEATYSPDELQHMIDYYGSDLGKSISSKGARLGGALSEAIDEVHRELAPEKPDE